MYYTNCQQHIPLCHEYNPIYHFEITRLLCALVRRAIMVDIHLGLAGIEGQGPRKILQHQDLLFTC